MRLRRTALFFLLLLLCIPAFSDSNHSDTVRVTPAFVVAGAPEIVRVNAPRASAVEGFWLDRKLEFFESASGVWVGLAGVDVQAPAGPSTLHVRVKQAEGWAVIDFAVDIHPAHYRTGTLTVAPRFVEPGPAAVQEIESEIQFKKNAFAHSAAEPLWRGDFQAPVRTTPTDSFGTRRMFNGKLASIHRGTDFHAKIGTPVRASNRGVVVLARKLYFEGNCVIIDHGMGLYTESMHFRWGFTPSQCTSAESTFTKASTFGRGS